MENAHQVGPVVKSGNRMLEARGMRLRIFPDLMSDMAKKVPVFMKYERLTSSGVKHGIIHPTTLIITFREESKKSTDHLVTEAYWKEVIELGLQNLR